MKLHEHPLVHNMSGGAAISHLANHGDENRYKLITSQYSAKARDCSFTFGGMLSQAQRMINKEDIQCKNTYFSISVDIDSKFQIRTLLINRS